MEILQFEAVGPKQEKYFVKVDAEESSDERAVIVRYTIAGGERRPAVANINFNLQSGEVLMTGLDPATTVYLACLISCGLGHLVEEILECWRRGHRTPRRMLDCLLDKGHSITPKLVNCSISCLSSFA